MILVITSLKLRRRLDLFRVWPHSFRSVVQLKRNSRCVDFKTIGFGNPSYTMTLWKDEDDMRAYVNSAAHSIAMRMATEYAQELRFLRLERDSLMKWSEAKKAIQENGRVIRP